MENYEYKIVTEIIYSGDNVNKIEDSNVIFQKKVDKFVEQGWELFNIVPVSTMSGRTAYLMITFRRKMQ